MENETALQSEVSLLFLKIIYLLGIQFILFATLPPTPCEHWVVKTTEECILVHE